MAANVAVRKTFYRLEQLAGGSPLGGTSLPQFALNSVFNAAILATNIVKVDAVNALGGADLGGFPWLYSKVTFRQDGLMQEAYSLQTILQWETELDS